MPDLAEQKRLRLNIKGCVQGVGMRPFVYRLAVKHKLSGWVNNTGCGVTIEIQGNSKHCSEFISDLYEELPPLAYIEDLVKSQIGLCNKSTVFYIKQTDHNHGIVDIPADQKVCQSCINELFNPNCRYHLYPFISCTDCGPRFSITKQLPFDRQNTSMSDFPLCQACEQAYNSPTSRRFHAQTIACQYCGPTLSHSFSHMIGILKDGGILALKGLGGYQLICDANNNSAISKLRLIKQRKTKAFALMVLNKKTAQFYGQFSKKALTLLNDSSAPIVLVNKKNNALPDQVAPNNAQLGFMLPTTGMHYLLFYYLLEKPSNPKWLSGANELALIVSSGNQHGEPLIIDDNQAQSLSQYVDCVVTHNRSIIQSIDDSVVSTYSDQSILIRRARGFPLRTITLDKHYPTTLGLGAELKTTICLIHENKAYLTPYIGDLNTRAKRERWHTVLDQLLNQLQVDPKFIAHDQHPDFYTTQIAESDGLPNIAIQHHKAHIGSVIVEHRITTPFIAFVGDGYGYGDDGQAWGGELFYCHIEQQYWQFERIGSLKPLTLPGADHVAREPWRMALSLLHELDITDHPLLVDPGAKKLMPLIQKKTTHYAKTSSLGRLTDGVSSLLGLCHQNNYESEAAIALQSAIRTREIYQQGWTFEGNYLSMLPAIDYILKNQELNGAGIWQATLANALADWIGRYAKRHYTEQIVVSGGCFLDAGLLLMLKQHLQARQLTLLTNESIPINDSGISVGQSFLVAQREG